ncbi:MAG: AarF/ABC1/UbiB kinase family protein, partial [Polyangiaceae bacterium]
MTIRFLRVLWLFGVILASYLVHFAFVRVFRRRGQRMPPWLKARRERVDGRNARRLLRGMLRLRGVFIKLGQVLSILGGFLPRAFTKELESLQDNVPPHPFRHVERTFVAAYGKKPDQCFA